MTRAIAPANALQLLAILFLPLFMAIGAATGFGQTVIMGPPVGTPGGHRMPRPKGVSTQSGLAMTLLMKESAPPTNGYLTLKADFESPTPLTSDTSITLAVHMADFYDDAGATIEADLDMVIGDTRKTLELTIPAYAMSHAMSWDVWVDGRLDRQLSVKKPDMQLVPAVVGQGQGRNEPALRILSPLTLGQVASVRALATSVTLSPDTSQLQLVSGSEIEVVSRPLPNDWHEYSPYDVVVLDVASLRALRSDSPPSYEALLAWIHSGGNLWVYHVGKEWEHLAEMSEQLGINFDAEGSPEPTPVGLAPGSGNWNYIDLKGANALVTPPTPGEPYGGVYQEDFTRLEQELETGNRGPEEEPLWSEDWFAVRAVGWGTVGAFKGDFTDFPRPFYSPEVATGFGFWMERSWDCRHGTEPRFANPAFSNWLVPGVGMAPVMGFQVLITLFIVTIGPLNYWLLKRARRLHLLVLTVPAFAALVTATLLAYGVLADGWAERVRALSYTYVDSQNNRASSWSRLSYYAAFAPSDGLTFPRESQVYPIEPGADDGYADPVSMRSLSLEWTKDTQHLSRGWLNSRTPTQYLVLETTPQAQGLEIGRHAEGLQAKSPYARPLRWVLAVDQEGNWFEARDVAPGASFRLTEVEPAAATAHFRRLAQDREPSVPAEIEGARLPRSMRRRYRGYSQNYAVSFDVGLLSDRWNQLMGRDGYEPLGLPQRTYLVVAEEALVTSLGLEGPTEEASLHFVQGDW